MNNEWQVWVQLNGKSNGKWNDNLSVKIKRQMKYVQPYVPKRKSECHVNKNVKPYVLWSKKVNALTVNFKWMANKWQCECIKWQTNGNVNVSNGKCEMWSHVFLREYIVSVITRLRMVNKWQMANMYRKVILVVKSHIQCDKQMVNIQ